MRAVGNVILGLLVLGVIAVMNPVLAVWDVLRKGQGPAYTPMGGYRRKAGQ